MRSNCFMKVKNLTDLWWGAGELHIENMVLYQWCLLGFLYEFVEGIEHWSIWSDVVDSTCYWVLLALNYYMFHTRFVSVERERYNYFQLLVDCY